VVVLVKGELLIVVYGICDYKTSKITGGAEYTIHSFPATIFHASDFPKIFMQLYVLYPKAGNDVSVFLVF
jgi:hypothetical protein